MLLIRLGYDDIIRGEYVTISAEDIGGSVNGASVTMELTLQWLMQTLVVEDLVMRLTFTNVESGICNSTESRGYDKNWVSVY